MTIDSIAYGNPTQSQMKILNTETYLDSIFSDLTTFTFPKNSSDATKVELNNIIEAIKELTIEEDVLKRYMMYDRGLSHFIKNFLIKNKADKTEVEAMVDSVFRDITPLIFKLKYYFNRPRPKQLAHYYKLKIFPFDSASADSPSYPSGHAFQGKIITEVIGNRYPSIYGYMKRLSDDICYSRVYLGLHYQSDIDVGIFAAEKVLDNKEFKLKYQL